MHKKLSSKTFKLKVKTINGFQEVDIDNKWIVPYSPILSKMFKAHINVEYCNSVKSIKYICKYVNKGSDQAVFGIQNDGQTIDEINGYREGRYISSNEAVWRILSFPIHERYPTVVHLSVHLENGQRVYFNQQNIQERVLSPPKTTLIAFFELCANDDFAKTLLYCEVPKYYTWNTTSKTFNRRKQGEAVSGVNGVKSSDALGRVYTVHPNNFECYFLRLLLHNVKGPTSFNDLKTVNGQICESFRETCQKLKLLEDDCHWDDTMKDAEVLETPSRIRSLFAILLTNCGLSNPRELWEKYQKCMAEDILNEAKRRNPSINIDYNDDMFNQALILIEDKTLSMVGKTLNELGITSPNRSLGNRMERELLRETSYNTDDLEHFVSENVQHLVADQKIAFDKIVNAVDNGLGGMYFLDAPGGTGKTFVINLLLAYIRKSSKIAIAMASSGIAATLLQGGRTAHSTLKLPLDLIHQENPICNISKGTGKAKVLEECKLIVWDECTMIHKNGLEALDRTLQDIKANKVLMGGVVVVLAGDFRQTLPVIPRGTMAEELKACLKSSFLWRKVQTLKLNTNMRVHLEKDVDAGRFASQLLMLGNGEIVKDPITDVIKLPDSFCNIMQSMEDLKNNVFPNVELNHKSHKWLCERAILAPRNDNVHQINHEIQCKIPGESFFFKSIDTVLDANEAVNYPVEFLNSLNPSGMPQHKLILKVGSPIMLLRNLDAPKLCNGTRLCVKSLKDNLIEATILTGCAKGEDVFIPRIPLIPSDTPFEFKRLQFPVRLAFAMSINKAQGQSLKVAGIDLSTHCFSHGQLYVAASRVGSAKNLFVLAPDGKTKNIVYYRALTDM